MRLLHTSDWHLGQNFYSKSRAAEHDAFLTWLLDRAQEHEVDAIIVAGDIFDTGSPPSYARELYNRFVVQLQQTGCRLVVLAGNHDSVAMLNESRDILAFLHTTVVANAGYAPIELPLRDGTPGAIFCPVPFLRPRELVTSQAGHSGREKQQLLLHAISDYYQEQYQQACALRGDRPLPIIASGHLTTVGASKKRCRPRHLHRHTGCLSGATLPPCRLHCAGPYSPGADGRRLRAYPLQRLAAAAKLR
ncbi:exonuclease SbcD [Klebsiella pneumoniae subsp. rhinoscleromatis]|nr:exonuclease SbcD [Klebsiella pneumoniae subsp. rhinoscleromatis]